MAESRFANIIQLKFIFHFVLLSALQLLMGAEKGKVFRFLRTRLRDSLSG